MMPLGEPGVQASGLAWRPSHVPMADPLPDKILPVRGAAGAAPLALPELRQLPVQVTPVGGVRYCGSCETTSHGHGF